MIPDSPNANIHHTHPRSPPKSVFADAFDLSVFATSGQLSTIDKSDTASAGTTGKVADGGHQHPVGASINDALVPTGAFLPYGGTSAPTGWLLCDGAAVSRSTYAALFAVLSTTYGAGDGSTTFNLPDYRGRFVLGKAAAGTGSTLGGTGGTIDHVHGLDTSSSGAKVLITSTSPQIRLKRKTVASYTTSHSATVTDGLNTDSTTVGTELIGNSDVANPPFQTANFIIKT